MRNGTNGHQVNGYPAARSSRPDGDREPVFGEDVYPTGAYPIVDDDQDVYPQTTAQPVTSAYASAYQQSGYAGGDQAGPYDVYGRPLRASGSEAEVVGNGYRQDGGSGQDPRQGYGEARGRRDEVRGPDPELDLDQPFDRSRRGAPATRGFPAAPPPLRDPTRSQPAVSGRSGWSAIGVEASPPMAAPRPVPKGPRLRVDWPNCKAHGLCHELLPEAVRLDEWGYPIVSTDGLPAHVIDDARRAVAACPTLALHLVD